MWYGKAGKVVVRLNRGLRILRQDILIVMLRTIENLIALFVIVQTDTCARREGGIETGVWVGRYIKFGFILLTGRCHVVIILKLSSRYL